MVMMKILAVLGCCCLALAQSQIDIGGNDGNSNSNNNNNNSTTPATTTDGGVKGVNLQPGNTCRLINFIPWTDLRAGPPGHEEDEDRLTAFALPVLLSREKPGASGRGEVANAKLREQDKG